MLIWNKDLTTVTKKNSSHELSDKWSPINASSSLKKFSLLEKVENFFTTLAAKQRFHHNRCKNKSSSENTRIFLPQFYTEAMRSSQVLTHARTRSCSTHHLRVWEHVQVKESQQLLFQESPQVFQGGAHTLCKIDESNNNVGRATVFDTKKRCDE
jgi:hypothetical protein